MDHQLIELELFMFVSTVHGEKCVEVNIAQSLLLLSVHNLATHLMVCIIIKIIHWVPEIVAVKRADSYEVSSCSHHWHQVNHYAFTSIIV